MIRSSQILTGRKRRMPAQRQSMVYEDHEWIKGPVTNFTIFARDYPLSPQEVRMLAEGERSDTYRVLNCDEELYVADDKLGVVGDIIPNLLGFDWRVVDSTRWGAGTRHNRYRIQKFQRATPP